MMEIRIGQKFRVKKEMPEKFDAKWITKGDIVRVIGVYPHHILVEKIKAGSHGWHMRQSYCVNGLWNDLEVVK